MKLVKFGIFALALGMFIASCGSSETETNEEPMENVEETTEMEMAPAVEEAPVMADSTATDSTMAAPAEESHEGHAH